MIPPATGWSTPDLETTDPVEQRLVLRGAALLRITGRRATPAERPPPSPLSAELAAALQEPPAAAARASAEPDAAGRRRSGRRLLIAAIATVGRRAADRDAAVPRLARRLRPAQPWRPATGRDRSGADLRGALLAMQVPVVTESMRLGRHLEIRLRMALAEQAAAADRPLLPEPADLRHGRPRPRHPRDAAAAGHGRATGAGAVRAAADAWRHHPDRSRRRRLAVAIAVAAIGIPVAVQPLMQERDLRVRNHAGALGGFYLDALLGLVPVRAHRAERRCGASTRVCWSNGRAQAAVGSPCQSASMACSRCSAWAWPAHCCSAISSGPAPSPAATCCWSTGR